MTKSPFKFLDSYTKEDREIFFGRDQEITDLYRRVFESKILLVYGVSGTGKSSLINCGLASRFDDSDWLPVNVRRGSNIIDSLNEAFNKQAISPLKKNLTFSEKLQSIYLDHFKPVYLIFDQFEELFIFGSHEEKAGFIKLIKEIIKSETQCRILFIIREEFLAGITEFEYDLPEIFSNRLRVEKMKRINAIQAIEGPCKVYNIETESGFAEELIDKLCPAGNEIELTYLQVFLDRILRLATTNSPFEGGQGGCPFTISLLSQVGNVSDLLGQFLEEQIRELDDPEIGMSILKSFVSVQGTKRHMNSSEIHNSVGAFGTVIAEKDLLKYLIKFVDLRILRERDDAGNFELRHDSLASKIYEKFTVIEKDIIEVRQFIENAFTAFEKRDKLLTAEDLMYIAPYGARLYLNKSSEAFIQKSKNEITRSRKRRRTFAGIAAILLFIVLSLFTIWAMNERGKAVKERENAEIQNEKALIASQKAIRAGEEALLEKNKALENERTAVQASEEAESAKEMALRSKRIADLNYLKARAYANNFLSKKIIETDPTIALRLAEYAISLDSLNPDLIDNLNRIYYDNNFYKIVIRDNKGISSVAVSPDGKNIFTGFLDGHICISDLNGNLFQTFKPHRGQIYSAAFSPDGKSILTGSWDKTASLCDLDGKILQEFNGHEDIVSSVAFSPDGKNILTGSWDKTARLWDFKGNVLQVFQGHDDFVFSVAFSPDGKNILTGSADSTACLWDLQGNVLRKFKGQSWIISVAFSPDGRSILTGSDDKTARLWDIQRNFQIEFKGHEDLISSIAFSPDGKSILTGSYDNTARLWDLQGNVLKKFLGHEDQVKSVAFCPDGEGVLTGSLDKTARLWDLQGNVLNYYRGHEGSVNSIAFSSDGKSILSGSNDRTARLWDLQGNILQIFRGHESEISSVAFSSDGKSILTSSWDYTVRLWNLHGAVLQVFKGKYFVRVLSVAFSPDGKNILTCSDDNTACLWDIKGNVVQMFTGYGNRVASVAFSPDGKTILTSSFEIAQLWGLNGKLLQVFYGHNDEIKSVAFSPDGKTILTGSSDKTARMWDLKGNVIQVFKGHKYGINSVAFSPDGKSILTGSTDKIALSWDLKGNILQMFKGHGEGINSVAFSPDGKSVLTGSSDKTARIWDIKEGHKEFQKSNSYQELSISQKIRYSVMEFSDVLKLKDEMPLSEGAEYYFGAINTIGNERKYEYIKNALKLYDKLLIINGDDKYLWRKEELMQLPGN